MRVEACMSCRLMQSRFQFPWRRRVDLLVLGRSLLTQEDNEGGWIRGLDCHCRRRRRRRRRPICARASAFIVRVRNFLCLMCDEEFKLDLYIVVHLGRGLAFVSCHVESLTSRYDVIKCFTGAPVRPEKEFIQ